MSTENNESLKQIDYWLRIIDETVKSKRRKILIGNKIDIKKREILNQDAVNFVCMNKLKLIHPKYSMFSFEYKNPKATTIPNIYKSVLTQKEWENAVKNPVIFHFNNSSTKPWKYSSTDPYPINVWYKYKNIKDKKLGLASKCV